MGKNVFEMIQDFGRRGKIHVVHFRNVSSPLPRFHETFPDDGYLDMYRVMKSLREVGFSGCAVPDHIPKLTGDDGLQRAAWPTASRACADCCRAPTKKWGDRC